MQPFCPIYSAAISGFQLEPRQVQPLNCYFGLTLFHMKSKGLISKSLYQHQRERKQGMEGRREHVRGLSVWDERPPSGMKDLGVWGGAGGIKANTSCSRPGDRWRWVHAVPWVCSSLSMPSPPQPPLPPPESLGGGVPLPTKAPQNRGRGWGTTFPPERERSRRQTTDVSRGQIDICRL